MNKVDSFNIQSLIVDPIRWNSIQEELQGYKFAHKRNQETIEEFISLVKGIRDTTKDQITITKINKFLETIKIYNKRCENIY